MYLPKLNHFPDFQAKIGAFKKNKQIKNNIDKEPLIPRGSKF